jgi:hypothetical protein
MCLNHYVQNTLGNTNKSKTLASSWYCKHIKQLVNVLLIKASYFQCSVLATFLGNENVEALKILKNMNYNEILM